MTHGECVEAATKWLWSRNDIVLPEFFCFNSELPDAIGFKMQHSTVVECKISRSDFLADKKKPCRNLEHPEVGMGNLRYYCCPKGMIQPEELPERWGLLYVYPSGFTKRIIDAGWHQKKDIVSEHHLLFYYARRAVYAGVHSTALSHRMYPKG